MPSIRLKARAKINLTLDVLQKRPDGYHEVEMVMQTIELHDLIEVEDRPAGIVIETDNPLVPHDDKNIAYKAALLLLDRYRVNRGVKIGIRKRIPVAAGLAGGSTDAAAVLAGLNRLWELGLSIEDLESLGAEIGSDVPFCVRGGTALATGRGEKLTSLRDAPLMWLVLAKPPLLVSTALVYRNYDAASVNRRPQTKAMLEALQAGDPAAITANLGNVLESVTLQIFPDVLQTKKAVAEAGASGALMSGSGPTVFGVARNQEEGEKIKAALQVSLPGYYVELTRTWSGKRQEFDGTE